ncbi:MAG TPA: SRPBCC family protein [Anaerolineales bacterium]|nr:SRPBCC family protein [Anaerolineales bacterium]
MIDPRRRLGEKYSENGYNGEKFVAAKRRREMIKVEASVLISRPVEEVFAFSNNPANSTKWQEGLVESRITSQGPIGVGTQITDVRKFLGRDLDSKLEVIAYQPNKSITLKTVSGPIHFQITQTYEVAEGGAKMTTIGEGEPGGLFKLAEGAVKKQFENQIQGDLARLKKVMEG